LWNLFKSGDKKAFRFIYDREYEALMSYARGMTSVQDLQEDAIHDVFVYIWNKRDKLADVDNIRPYLLVSLRHSILALLKKRKFTELKPADESFLEYEDSAEDRLIELEFQAELKGRLNEAFKQLSSRQKEAMYLRFFEMMAYEDICNAMSINYQSVRNLISAASKKLAAHLKNNS